MGILGGLQSLLYPNSSEGFTLPVCWPAELSDSLLPLPFIKASLVYPASISFVPAHILKVSVIISTVHTVNAKCRRQDQALKLSLSLALPVQPFKLPQNVPFHWCVSWFRSLGCVDEDVVWGFTLNKVGCFLSLGLGLFSVHHFTPHFLGFQKRLVAVGRTPALTPGRSGWLFPSTVLLFLLSFLLSFYGAGNWV